MGDLIQVIEAAYTAHENDTAWLEGLASTAANARNGGCGVVALSYDATQSDWVDLRQVAAPGVDPGLLGKLFSTPAMPKGETRFVASMFRGVPIVSPDMLEKWIRGRRAGAGEIQPSARQTLQYFFKATQDNGFDDFAFVNAVDPTYIGCALIMLHPHRHMWTSRDSGRWRLVAAHVAAGHRVRRLLGGPPPEAVMRPDGRLDHAEAPAQGNLVRAALRRGVRAMDRARGPLRRKDPSEALAIWEGLVAGRWSLVDHVESDGRRVILARRNDPGVPDIRGLTLRERQAIAYAVLGHANKVIAYELGLTTSTVADHLRRARQKLGLRSLAALRDVVIGAGPANPNATSVT